MEQDTHSEYHLGQHSREVCSPLERVVSDHHEDSVVALQHVASGHPSSFSSVLQKRYGESLLCLNRGKDTVFFVEGRSVPECPGQYAVIKYLAHSDAGRRELHYTEKYAGWVGPKLYAVHQLPEGIELVIEAGSASLRWCLQGIHHPKNFKDKEVQLATAHAIAELAYCIEQEDDGHYDLKPENILLFDEKDGSASYCLADFGLTRSRQAFQELMEQKKHHMGTYGYMAPEFFRLSSSYSHCVPDIYAYGMLLYELIQGDLPRGLFVDDLGKHFAVMSSSKYRHVLLDFPLCKSRIVQELFYSCTEENPLMRPQSFGDILCYLEDS